MRLVDADALESETCCGCKNYEHKYANCIDCALANAPTIDAIPVEWLKTQLIDEFYDELIFRWQKEQEAR